MDASVLGALIGATGTVIGAVIGRSDLLDRIIRRSGFPRITGKWESTWVESDGDHREIFTITKQNGARIYGFITMEKEPDKKWKIQGDFNGRFLRLFWHPSEDADDKFFLDYGCYFFEMNGDGTFDGYAVGFDWQLNAIDVGEHKLKRIK